MFGSVVRRFAIVAVMLAAVLCLSARESEAHWGRWWRWHHYRPYVHVYRPVVYSPVVYASWSYRPVYSWYGSTCCDPCVYGCCDVCSYSYCDPCCGAVADCCGGTVVSERPAEPGPAPSAEPAEGASPAESSVLEPRDTELPLPPEPAAVAEPQTGAMALAVDVPEDARVFVNGFLTNSTGVHRRYVSRDLASGLQYTYRVRVLVHRDGKVLSDTQIVRVAAGDTANLAFDFDTQSSPGPTTLTVHVPDDADVTLEGRDTEATGSVRRFTTTKLARGAEWNDYSVVVALQRDGRTETRQKTVNLIGGESRELTFDFGRERLAAR